LSLSRSERLLARYAHPDESPTDEVELSGFAPFIQRNNLAASLAANAPDRFGDLEDWTLRRRSLDEVATLRDEFEARDVTFAVIKSLPIVPKPVGDIDLLVDDLAIGAEVLVGMSYTVASRERYKVVYERHFEDCRVAFHLHAQVAWEGIPYLEPDDILAARTARDTPAGTFDVPSPSDELLITAAHALFERGNMSVIVLDVIEYGLHFESRDIDIEGLLRAARAYGWDDSLRRYLRAVDAIHRQLFGRPISSAVATEIGDPRAPPYDSLFRCWPFPVRAVVADRTQKLRGELGTIGPAALARRGVVYAGDVVAVVTQRYGITYTGKRLNRLVGG
jgi:hypothetical protein